MPSRQKAKCTPENQVEGRTERKVRNMGSAGKENLAVEAPGEAGNIVATVPEEDEAQKASEVTQAETMAAPEANEATAAGKPEETGTPQAPGGAL